MSLWTGFGEPLSGSWDAVDLRVPRAVRDRVDSVGLLVPSGLLRHGRLRVETLGRLFREGRFDDVRQRYRGAYLAEELAESPSAFPAATAWVAGPQEVVTSARAAATLGRVGSGPGGRLAVVFGFRHDEHGRLNPPGASAVFEVIRLVVSSRDEDWAILEVDRPLDPAHPPLPRADATLSAALDSGTRLATLAHPLGQPLKCTAGVLLSRGFVRSPGLRARLPRLTGDAGAPVLLAEGPLAGGVVGFLPQAHGRTPDFVPVAGDTCYAMRPPRRLSGRDGEERIIPVSVLPAILGQGEREPQTSREGNPRWGPFPAFGDAVQP